MSHSRTVGSTFVGVLVMLVAGAVYGWSVLSGPIAADFPEWNLTQLSLTFTVCMVFCNIGNLLSGFLQRRFSGAFCVRISSVLFLLGMLLTSRAQSLPMLYVGFGIICGVATGLSYVAVMNTFPQRFPKNPALVSGMLLMAFGASSMILGAVYTAVTPARTGAWRTTLLVMGIVVAAVLLVCSFVLRKPKNAAVNTAQTEEGNNDHKPVQMLRHSGFWFLFIWVVLLAVVGLVVIAQARPLAESVGPAISAQVISVVVGLISVFNGLGRLLMGAVFDRCGYKRTMIVVMLLYLVGVIGLTVSSLLGSFPLLVVAFLLVGMGYGGSMNVTASFVRKGYGQSYYSVNFSIALLSLMVASLGSPLAGSFYDKTGSFFSTFILLFVCIAVAVIFLLGAKIPQDGKKKR